MEKDKGVYCLVIKLSKSTKIKIGKLGKINFLKGFYLYSGSAMNGLTNRINMHRKKQKKLFWHIDYLLKSKYTKIVQVITIRTNKKLEYQLNRVISYLPNSKPIKGFGCSDCTCKSHLFHFSGKNLKEIINRIKL